MLDQIKYLFSTTEAKRYFRNTSWMMGEKVLTMGLAFLVNIFVARHLGPDKYGVLSYAISLTSLFAISTHLGLKGLAVRELVKFPESNDELMGTISGLKFISSVLATFGLLAFIILTGETENVEFWVLLVASGTVLFKPFEVFDYWFQAKVEAEYSSKVRGISTITISIFKIVLVITGAKVLAFAYAYLFQAIIIGILFIVAYLWKSHLPIRKWKFKFKRAKELLGQGWMIMLGSFFAVVYLKIDQVMLRWIISSEEVGIYSVAAKLSEAWYFIPGVIVASLFPKLIELQKTSITKYKKRLQQLLDLLFGMAFIIAVVVTFISKPLIIGLYGPEYQETSLILSIHIWAGIFVFMRSVFSKWILIEDAIVFSMITHGFGALLNVALNFFLIPIYAGVGAAIATILSYAMASYFSLFFYKKSKPIFWMMSKSIISPFRYLIKFYRQ